MQILTFEPAEFRDLDVALAMARKGVEGPGAPTAANMDTLSQAYEQKGDLEAAMECQAKAWAATDPEDDLAMYVEVGQGYMSLARSTGDSKREKEVVQAFLSRAEALAKVQDRDTAQGLNRLAVVLARCGHLHESIEVNRMYLDRQRRIYGQEHPQVALAMNNLGAGLLDNGNPQEAEPLLRSAVDIYRKTGGEHSFAVGNTRSHLGECLTKLGRFEEAERELLEAHRVLEGVEVGQYERTRRARKRLTALYEAWEATSSGKGYMEKAAEWKAKADLQ
jgi:tetratricopeptide (TPR) repeat protein